MASFTTSSLYPFIINCFEKSLTIFHCRSSPSQVRPHSCHRIFLPSKSTSSLSFSPLPKRPQSLSSLLSLSTYTQHKVELTPTKTKSSPRLPPYLALGQLWLAHPTTPPPKLAVQVGSRRASLSACHTHLPTEKVSIFFALHLEVSCCPP